MQGYLAALSIVLLLATVLTRAYLMRREGARAIHFGSTDRSDFLILPFALFYFYTIFAAAFDLPVASSQVFFRSNSVSWLGVGLCYVGLLLLLLSLASFGASFRVGIDVSEPGALVTSGLFAYSRNPIYVAFGLVLLGQFLVFPNWILLLYLIAGVLLFHRQVLREEAYLKEHYGQDYTDYSRRVRRYF